MTNDEALNPEAISGRAIVACFAATSVFLPREERLRVRKALQAQFSERAITAPPSRRAAIAALREVLGIFFTLSAANDERLREIVSSLRTKGFADLDLVAGMSTDKDYPHDIVTVAVGMIALLLSDSDRTNLARLCNHWVLGNQDPSN